uniref:Peroxisomal membrane protein 11C n=1 Tax=Megaselia scalaris TaxID=36166 RepID=T1GCN1_MEGSC
MKGLCYSAKLVSGLQKTRNPEWSRKFGIISSKISGARATLRLIDDIPMIKYALDYGLGFQEKDAVMASLGITANVVDLLYYPIEKICWLAEHKVMNVEDPDKWDILSSWFWVASIYLNLMRLTRNFTKLEEKRRLMNERSEELIKKQRLEVISMIRGGLDLVHAVSTLPKGYLWGGKLETWHVGLIGTTSAALGLYQIFLKKRK